MAWDSTSPAWERQKDLWTIVNANLRTGLAMGQEMRQARNEDMLMPLRFKILGLQAQKDELDIQTADQRLKEEADLFPVKKAQMQSEATFAANKNKLELEDRTATSKFLADLASAKNKADVQLPSDIHNPQLAAHLSDIQKNALSMTGVAEINATYNKAFEDLDPQGKSRMLSAISKYGGRVTPEVLSELQVASKESDERKAQVKVKEQEVLGGWRLKVAQAHETGRLEAAALTSAGKIIRDPATLSAFKTELSIAKSDLDNPLGKVRDVMRKYGVPESFEAGATVTPTATQTPFEEALSKINEEVAAADVEATRNPTKENRTKLQDLKKQASAIQMRLQADKAPVVSPEQRDRLPAGTWYRLNPNDEPHMKVGGSTTGLPSVPKPRQPISERIAPSPEAQGPLAEAARQTIKGAVKAGELYGEATKVPYRTLRDKIIKPAQTELQKLIEENWYGIKPEDREALKPWEQ